MKPIVYFYLPKGTLNDATEYYCNIIKRAFKQKGYIIETRDLLFKVKHDVYIVAITPANAYQIKKKNPKSRLVTWFQGVGPEEYIMLHGKTVKSFLVKKLSEYWERKALTQSDIRIFVSEAMLDHYKSKYQIPIDNYLIIPCYNKALNKDLIIDNSSKYENLSFVYAGSLYKWQCIEKTLEVFREVEKIDSSAHLTLLTKDETEAKQMVESSGIKNFDVKYVPLEYLDKELTKYKYGFLLREDNIVNRVATPTKMNSYLSVGTVPIYSNVVDSFKKNLDLTAFQVSIGIEESSKEIAQKIINQHRCEIDSGQFISKLEENFNRYYNDNLYVNEIITRLD